MRFGITANTILSDINEIQTGYFLNGEVWFDVDAKNEFNLRTQQATPSEVEDAIGKLESR